MDLSGATFGVGIGVGVTIACVVLGLVFGRKRRAGDESTPAPANAAPAPPDQDPFVHGSATEKRRSRRRAGNPVRVLVTNAVGKSRPREAWVVDRSQGGLRLSYHRAIREGTVLRVCAAGVSPPVSVEVQVRYCIEAGSGWTVGCRFVTPPRSDVLWTFG